MLIFLYSQKKVVFFPKNVSYYVPRAFFTETAIGNTEDLSGKISCFAFFGHIEHIQQ
jgi:hypothetical protein